MKSALFALTIWLVLLGKSVGQDVSIDPTFGTNGTGYSSIYYPGLTEMAIRRDKRIVLAGYFQFESDSFTIGLSGYTSEGLPDSSFANGGATYLEPLPYYGIYLRDVIELPDDKILVGAYLYNDDDEAFLLAKVMPDGRIDSSFGEFGSILFTGLSAANASGISFTTDLHSNIYLIGSELEQQAIRKLLPDGIPDASFGNQGKAVMPIYQDSAWSEFGTDIIILPDGRFLTTARVVVDNDYLGVVTSRWLSNGMPDVSFAQQGSYFLRTGDEGGNFWSMHPQTDGGVIYKNYFSFGYTVFLFRLNEEGERELAFGENGLASIDSIFITFSNDGLITCPDGSLLTLHTTWDGSIRRTFLMRYHPDFLPDTTFGDHGRFEIPAEIMGLAPAGLLIQEPNKILLNIISDGPFDYFTTLIRIELDEHTSTHTFSPTKTSFSVYPNPVRESFNLRFDNTQTMFVKRLELLDVQGRMFQQFMHEQVLEPGVNELTFTVAENIPAGMYFVRVTHGGGIDLFPVAIHR